MAGQGTQLFGYVDGMVNTASQLNPDTPGSGSGSANSIAGLGQSNSGLDLPGCTQFFAEQAASAQEYANFLQKMQQGTQSFHDLANNGAAQYSSADSSTSTGFTVH